MAPKRTFADCPDCTARVDVRTLEAHRGGPKCTALKIALAFEARGWVQLDATYARIAVEAGAPHETAMAGLHEEEFPIGLEEKGTHRRLKTAWKTVAHEVTFAPKGVSRVLVALNKVKIEGDFRRRAVAALWDQAEDILLQIETIKRLDGNVRSYVHRLVVEAEERKALRENEAPRASPTV